MTSEKYQFEYILIDMSPNISATNANILMESDYFILPCAPDYFCYMAIDSLTKVFPRWDKAYSKLKETDVFMSADYKMSNGKPQFIGTIQFERGESSEDTNGFGPIISWYNANGDVIETISVMSDDTIIYNNYFWAAINGSIE